MNVNVNEPVNVIMYVKRDFAGVIKLRVLRQCDHPALAKRAQLINGKGPHQGEAGRDHSQSRIYDNRVKMMEQCTEVVTNQGMLAASRS